MTIKKEVLAGVASAAALVATGSSASAADIQPDDWSGFYVGLSTGFMSGDLPLHHYNHDYTLNSSAPVPGGFAGFNVETGNLVLGAELALQLTTPAVITKNSDGYGLNNTFDAKAKIGYDLGKFMIYGFGGATSQSVFGGQGTYSAYGVNFGAGLDVKVSEHVTIGAEFIRREMQGMNTKTHANQGFGENEFALRAAYHF